MSWSRLHQYQKDKGVRIRLNENNRAAITVAKRRRASTEIFIQSKIRKLHTNIYQTTLAILSSGG